MSVFLKKKKKKRKSIVLNDTKINLKMKNKSWLSSTANKFYSSASHHEQKNKKTTGQIKFSAVTVKQQIKVVLQHSIYE